MPWAITHTESNSDGEQVLKLMVLPESGGNYDLRSHHCTPSLDRLLCGCIHQIASSVQPPECPLALGSDRFPSWLVKKKRKKGPTPSPLLSCTFHSFLLLVL